MNFYVSVINEVVEHIEGNLCEKLSLSDLSSRSGISDFHFNRMFKTVAGVTLKQYILGRKLTNAMEQLKTTSKSIIDIALESGFEYPEVFSRAFKKQFGVSPAGFRRKEAYIEGVEKATIVERDIINYRGNLALKGRSVFLEPFKLNGVNVPVNTNSINFKSILKTKTEAFILESAKNSLFKNDKFYTIVSCNGNDDGGYNVFCGRQPRQAVQTDDSAEFLVPGGWYADFIYMGDMFDIREVFIDDLYKWIMVKEAEISINGVGMLNIYENSYPLDNKVHILVPIKKPV